MLSAEPASNGEVPASWLIEYTEGLPIALIDLGRDGYALLDVECVASPDTVQWSVDINIVDAVLSGSGPLSLDCLFIQSPADLVPAGGFIEAYKFIDPTRTRARMGLSSRAALSSSPSTLTTPTWSARCHCRSMEAGLFGRSPIGLHPRQW